MLIDMDMIMRFVCDAVEGFGDVYEFLNRPLTEVLQTPDGVVLGSIIDKLVENILEFMGIGDYTLLFLMASVGLMVYIFFAFGKWAKNLVT